ncbi:MAG: hypothetical protein ACYCW6_17855 [Candidatus Xenobia bacterium]
MSRPKYAPLPIEPATREVRLHGRRLTLRELPLGERLRLEHRRSAMLDAVAAQQIEEATEALSDLLAIMLPGADSDWLEHLAAHWPGMIDVLLAAQGQLDLQPSGESDGQDDKADRVPEKQPGSEAWEAACVSVARFFGVLPLDVFRTFPARYIARYHLLALREETQRNLLQIRLACMQAGADPDKVTAPDWLTDDGTGTTPRPSSRLEQLKADVAAGKYDAVMEQARRDAEELRRTGRAPQGAIVTGPPQPQGAIVTGAKTAR